MKEIAQHKDIEWICDSVEPVVGEKRRLHWKDENGISQNGIFEFTESGEWVEI